MWNLRNHFLATSFAFEENDSTKVELSESHTVRWCLTRVHGVLGHGMEGGPCGGQSRRAQTGYLGQPSVDGPGEVCRMRLNYFTEQ